MSDARPPAPISVLVVEADAAIRDRFVDMIRATPGMALWGASSCLRAARTLLGAMPAPDVAIVGLALADGDATELIAEFAARPGSTVALVATVIGDEAYVLRAFEAGARGCLLKDSTTQELAHAIRLVHEGDAALSPRVAGRLLERFAALRSVDRLRAAALRDAPDRLSLREAEILSLIAQGHSVLEVALHLHRSHHTVSTHVKHIYEKLTVCNRMQAINRARQTGQIA